MVDLWGRLDINLDEEMNRAELPGTVPFGGRGRGRRQRDETHHPLGQRARVLAVAPLISRQSAVLDVLPGLSWCCRLQPLVCDAYTPW